MTKNRQKNGSLNRDLLNFLYRYGIFWMPPCESSHPGGSEYVWQRGVEGVLGRVTGGPSWPYFPKKLKLKCSVKKNKHGHNFQNIASKTNQHWVIVYDPTLIHFGADIPKIVSCLFFLTPHNFANGPHFVALTQLRATKTGSNICCTHLSHTFAVAWLEYFWHWTLFFWKWKHSH